jgi:hypothetical protein
MTLLAAALAETPVTSWPNLLTWGGLAVLVMVSIVRGWLVPKASHERELQVQQESHDKVVQALKERLVDKSTEIEVWRKVATTEQASTVELLAQHRMALETGRATVYALEGFREGLVKAQKEIRP